VIQRDLLLHTPISWAYSCNLVYDRWDPLCSFDENSFLSGTNFGKFRDTI